MPYDAPAFTLPPEPLLREEDLAEFHSSVGAYQDGSWDADRWRTYRLRYGIYQQRQEGEHMVRIKIPGGRLNVSQLRGLAKLNRENCSGQLHFTTRQDAQVYGVRTEGLAKVIDAIYDAGLTTRESSGSTFRNVTTCPLSGSCPRELVNSADLADRITRAWLRHPLVQHMPRKFKIATSGCEHDCGATRIDDLGFIARRKDGKNGFLVVAGGGLGAHPRLAVDIIDFVEESDVAAVQEAIARVHNAHSNRKRRNTSRIKFLVDKFGQEVFGEMVRAEFEKIKDLPKRPWEPLTWNEAEAGPPPGLPGGRYTQPDGSEAVILRRPLGRYDSDELDSLADLMEAHGSDEARATRDQNVAVLGLAPDKADAFIAAAEKLGHEVTHQGNGLGNVAACPGTSTCPIGITNSTALAREIYADEEIAALPEHRIRISGCQNSCGHHHIADFGLHGLGKKIEGRHAPHYQVHIGGSIGEAGAVGVAGPLVSAHKAKDALKLLIAAYRDQSRDGETPRFWAERMGEEGIEAILAPVMSLDPTVESNFIDFGMDEEFAPPTTSAGECAAPAVIAEQLADAGEVGLIDMQRWLTKGEKSNALEAGNGGMMAAAQRLLVVDGVKRDLDQRDMVIEKIRERYGANGTLLAAMEAVLEAEKKAAKGDFAPFVKELERWLDIAREATEETITRFVQQGAAA